MQMNSFLVGYGLSDDFKTSKEEMKTEILSLDEEIRTEKNADTTLLVSRVLRLTRIVKKSITLHTDFRLWFSKLHFSVV